MPTPDPYSFDDVKAFVEDAVRRMKPVHEKWRALQVLYRIGEWRGGISESQLMDLEELIGAGVDHELVNLVLPNVNIILASIIARDPAHLVEPLDGDEQAEDYANAAEKALRHFWRRTQGTDDLRSGSKDAVRLGNGFLKGGWQHAETEVDRPDAEMIEDLDALAEADRLFAELDPETGPTPVSELVEYVPLTQAIVEADEPFLAYVSPFDMFLPRDARRMHETRWVAERLRLPVGELRALQKASPDFDSSVDVVANADPLHGRGRQASTVSEDHQLAEVFEFYDMRARRVVVFQADSDKPLADFDMPWGHGRPPYVHVQGMREDESEFWCFGILEAIAAPQAMMTEAIEEQLASMRRSGPKYAVAKGSMTEDLRMLLTSEESDVVAEVETPNGAQIGDVIQAFQRVPTPPEVFGTRNDAREWMESILGINDFMAGGSGADRMSATAAAVVDGVATLRAAEWVAAVEQASSDAGTLMLLLMQEFLDGDRAIRIVGAKGAIWEKVSREQLQGEFKVSVEGGSTRAVNPATRQQKAMQLVNELIPALGEAGYDTAPAWRQAITDLGFDPELLLAPAPQPEPEPAPPADPMAGMGPMMDPMAGMGGPPGPPMMDVPVSDEERAAALGLTVPQEELGGPPIPAAIGGGLAL